VLLETDNIKQASIAAGFRSGTGYKIQYNPIIKKRIEEERKRLRRAHMATVDRAVEGLARVAFAEMGEFMRGTTRGSWRSCRRPSSPRRSGPRSRRSAPEASPDARPDKNGGEISTTTTYTEIELHHKLGALEKLVKHVGFYQEDGAETGTPRPGRDGWHPRTRLQYEPARRDGMPMAAWVVTSFCVASEIAEDHAGRATPVRRTSASKLVFRGAAFGCLAAWLPGLRMGCSDLYVEPRVDASIHAGGEALAQPSGKAGVGAPMRS
jgi:hypothetical protein